MTSRRSFLGTLAAGVTAASAVPRVAAAAGKPPLGLQLWSVRNQLAKDVPGTLKQIKAWGFDEVEGFGKYAGGIAAELKAAGLRMPSMHVGFEDLEKDLAAVIKDADAVGAKTIVNPYLPHKQKPHASREEILAAASSFSKWAKECKAAGKRFGYHIHGQEFGPAPEGTLFDVLAEESGPDVGFEADVYWVTFGGADPVALLKKYKGRVWYTHVKDMAKGIVPTSEQAHSESAERADGHRSDRHQGDRRRRRPRPASR